MKSEVRPLLLPNLVYLVSLFSPAIHTITWTQPEWYSFVKDTGKAVENFEILVSR